MTFRWLITGAAGQFGSVVHQMLQRRGEPTLGLVRSNTSESHAGDTLPMDICDHAEVSKLIRDVRPQFVIHAAAIANAHVAYLNPALARQTNTEATAHLARVAAEHGVRFTYISTDLVFDGTAAPYDEDAIPTPISVYGQTKAEAEQDVLGADGLVIRPGIMYGIPIVSRPTVFLEQLKVMASGSRLELFEDQFRTPIALEDAAVACIEATEHAVSGVLHVAGPERLSRLQMGRIMARSLGVPESLLVATRQRDLESAEPRPADVSLNCRRFTQLLGRAPGRRMSVVMQKIARDLPLNKRG